MPTTGRVFAHVMDWGPPVAPAVDGTLKVRVEWSLLHGTRANGKFVFTSEPLLNGDKLRRDIVDALVIYLNGKYPGAAYKDREVVLL